VPAYYTLVEMKAASNNVLIRIQRLLECAGVPHGHSPEHPAKRLSRLDQTRQEEIAQRRCL
jgi:hypothetical protein